MTPPIRLRRSRVRGQALVESLVAMVVMLALYGAISWLGRFQDMALQAAHASRFAAFSLARNESLRPIAQIRRHYFSGPAHQWKTPDGKPVLSERLSEVALAVSSGQGLGAQALPGGSDPAASALRHGLRLDGSGIRHAYVSLQFPAWPDPARRVAVGQEDAFPDKAWPHLSSTRQTAILTDAGHASDDVHAQRRVADSGPGWRDIVDGSYALGGRISSRMAAVDKAWGREEPRLDWLEPWAGYIPDHHLGSSGDIQ